MADRPSLMLICIQNQIAGPRVGTAMRTSEQETIEAALSGDAGRLIFAFASTDKDKRSAQIVDALRRLPLEGLFVRIRLNPEDAMRHPIPVEAQGRLRSWGADDAVPEGEFNFAISKA